MHPLSLLAVAVLCFGGRATGSQTWVVDDDGGPNADFTDIQTAIDFATHGDVILVERGTYAGFTLSEGIVVQGSGDAPFSTITGPVSVTLLPVDRVAVVSRFVILDDVNVSAADGVVALDHLSASKLLVASSADVRAIGCEIIPSGVSVATSRVELTRCLVRSSHIWGVRAHLGGTAVLARSSIRGSGGAPPRAHSAWATTDGLECSSSPEGT